MIKVIFWDFDGVLMDSNTIRDKGFKQVLAEFPKDTVDQLLTFHQMNVGLREMDHHPYRCKKINSEGYLEPIFGFKNFHVSTNRQDLVPAYFLSHNF